MPIHPVSMVRYAGLLGFITASVLPGVASAQTLFGPSPYLSSLDSPFSGTTFTYFHLEDFEDNALNTPGLSATGGVVLLPGPSTDSVDADGDDMQIDGSGTSGNSFFSSGLGSVFEFTFDAVALGSLPTHVGLVWTDVGTVAAPGMDGFDAVTFEAFDALGVSVGVIGPVVLGDGLVSGGTAEDRFFGASSLAGIRRMRISMSASTDWEVDHIQYGLIPSPGSGAIIVGVGLLAMRRRR